MAVPSTILRALEDWMEKEHDGRVAPAAEELGLSRQALYSLLNGTTGFLRARTAFALKNVVGIPFRKLQALVVK